MTVYYITYKVRFKYDEEIRWTEKGQAKSRVAHHKSTLTLYGDNLKGQSPDKPFETFDKLYAKNPDILSYFKDRYSNVQVTGFGVSVEYLEDTFTTPIKIS